MFKPNLFLFGAFATATILVSSTGIQNVAFAHQRQLFTIGDKDYLFVVGSLNEPIFVDDKSGVEFAAYWPNATDPLNSDANGTRPIEGLEKMLKVEISAGNKNKTLDFEPAFREPGNYEAPNKGGIGLDTSGTNMNYGIGVTSLGIIETGFETIQVSNRLKIC